MRWQVKFRFNTQTGEIETFTVTDADKLGSVGTPTHEQRHESFALEIGRLCEPHPLVSEIMPEMARAESVVLETETPTEEVIAIQVKVQ